MISAVLFISFFVFLIMGVPIAICLGLFSFWLSRFSYFPEISWQKPEFPKDLSDS